MTELVPGAIIASKFRLERIIGRGGMGAVWAARARAARHAGRAEVHRTRVADSPEARVRFEREAKAAAAAPLAPRRADHRPRHRRRRAATSRWSSSRARTSASASAARDASPCRRGAHPHPGREGPPPRARGRHHPPRPQAREHLPRALRRRRGGQGPRLRRRQDAHAPARIDERPRHADRRRLRLAFVHEPGAGARRARPRPPHRPLVARGHRLPRHHRA